MVCQFLRAIVVIFERTMIEERGNRAEVSPGWSLDLTLRAYFEDTAGDGWKEFTEAVKRAHHSEYTITSSVLHDVIFVMQGSRR